MVRWKPLLVNVQMSTWDNFKVRHHKVETALKESARKQYTHIKLPATIKFPRNLVTMRRAPLSAREGTICFLFFKIVQFLPSTPCAAAIPAYNSTMFVHKIIHSCEFLFKQGKESIRTQLHPITCQKEVQKFPLPFRGWTKWDSNMLW